MILLDTSVWIDHLRKSEDLVGDLLAQDHILAHPFVIGELALGSMRRYDLMVTALLELPQAAMATTSEVLHFVKRHALMGSGIGYVDAHLLASAKLMPSTLLWTRDKRLKKIATALGVGFSE